MLPEADDGGDVPGVLVGEALHQDLLVGPPRPDLQPLQVQQLLEDAPLDLVPGERRMVDININHIKVEWPPRGIGRSSYNVQGDPSGWLKPQVDLNPTVLAAIGPPLQLPTAQAGWRNIPDPSQREVKTILAWWVTL